MIFYFSGTGNSKFTAERINDTLNDTIVIYGLTGEITK